MITITYINTVIVYIVTIDLNMKLKIITNNLNWTGSLFYEILIEKTKFYGNFYHTCNRIYIYNK